MKPGFNKITLLVVVLLLVSSGGVWWRFSSQHAQTLAAAESKSQDKKILYWYDPMAPNQHFDKPGKSPFMDMPLVPKYDEPQQPADTVSIDPRTVQNMAVRTGVVARGPLSGRVDAVGYVRVDERKIQVVQARAQGWVEHLNINAANDPVKLGQLLLELYSPDLLAAQEEYLLVRHSSQKHRNADVFLAATKAKMQLLGMTVRQIAELEQTNQASRLLAFYAPANGIVTELGVRQGMQVDPGMNLFSIADLSSVWVTAEVPESQAARVREGNPAEISFPALSGKVYKGLVNYVSPQVSATSRTLQVRIRLENPGNVLKPDMFANVALFNGEKRDALLVPSEAIIATGRRNIVIVAEGNGKFHPVDVTVGRDVGGQTEILKGLTAGQTVVTSGQFLIDSESNAKAGFERFEGAQTPGSGEDKAKKDSRKTDDQAMKPNIHHGRGRINRIDPGAGKINLSHDPIPTLSWPEMTMDFPVADKKALTGAKPGDTIEFELAPMPSGEYIITRIIPGKRPERK